MVLINFITDINNQQLLKDVDILFKAFGVKYAGGNYKKNLVSHLSYKCESANINIFYCYINNLLLPYSQNNIFIFDKLYFCQAWKSQLSNYDPIIVKFEDDKIIDYSINKNTMLIDWNNKDINQFNKSVLQVSKQIKSLKLPNINPSIDFNDLPKVSVCIPTCNRKKFIKLINLNLKNMTYPQDKLEIIILDDGTEEIQDLLSKQDNIKYYKYSNKNTIGFKRNECVRLASNDIIAFMDDDDYYYPNSLFNRVCHLITSKKDCIFCSTIGCFSINKFSSIINCSPIEYPLEKKVSEATLTFKKSFWDNNNFDNNDKFNEGEFFVKNSISKCKEISWEGIIVQLLHTYNTCKKNLDLPDKNGSHFNFSDDDFEIITSI